MTEFLPVRSLFSISHSSVIARTSSPPPRSEPRFPAPSHILRGGCRKPGLFWDAAVLFLQFLPPPAFAAALTSLERGHDLFLPLCQ